MLTWQSAFDLLSSQGYLLASEIVEETLEAWIPLFILEKLEVNVPGNHKLKECI